ncbi:unnamed protein product [Urochloa humidicola]
MARFSCSVMLLLALLGFLAVAAAAVPGGGGCEVSALAADVAASCAGVAATPPCCEPVLASVELGGGACLCRLASEMNVIQAGLNGSALAALYAGCGGATSLTACHGVLPSGSVILDLALPSSPAATHLAGVEKDRVGGMPESSSASNLRGSTSPPSDVVRVTLALVSDDKKLLRESTSWQVAGAFAALIFAAIEICGCIYGCKG